MRPATAGEVRGLLAWAAAEEVPLDIVGAGTKRAFGHAVSAAHRVDLTALSGIVDYEPAELVLTAHAATPIAEIEAMLRQSDQIMAFEPPDLGPLFGEAPEKVTLGGILAGNLSGPRRVLAGACRDHVLGVEVATGRGELVKAGGRVVKNVTGYDLTKLMCGSWGTLGVVTAVSVKVLPAAEKTRTVLVAGLTPEAANEAMTIALSRPHEVSAATFVPSEIAARSSVSYVAEAGRAITAIRVEGPPVSVSARNEALHALLGPLGDIEELHGHNSVRFWQEVRDVAPLIGNGDAIWRLHVPPASGGAVLGNLVGSGVEGYLDWGGGLLWCSAPATAEASKMIRTAAGTAGGHATMVRASDALKASVPVFHPQPESRAALTVRIKQGFDPSGILNPGRMG
ncbi:MAG: glycolate oxidase subunit GlcE [Rhodospirillales bacterium]|nr:glycolate oxidase subunit GlcE [Rhodospirillales bacterium]